MGFFLKLTTSTANKQKQNNNKTNLKLTFTQFKIRLGNNSVETGKEKFSGVLKRNLVRGAEGGITLQ